MLKQRFKRSKKYRAKYFRRRMWHDSVVALCRKIGFIV